VAVDLDRLQHGLGQELVPAVALGDLVDVVQQALVDDVAELLGGVELRGRRRVATGNAIDGDRARLLAQGDGGVDPDAALGLVGLGQRLGGGGSPPDVHQWMTSAFSGWAAAGRAAAASRAAARA
jgi:hypothetical protein